MTVLVAALAVVVAFLGLLVAGLLRSHAEILRALQSLGADLDPDAAPRSVPVAAPRKAPPAGARANRPAADIAGTSPSGDAVSLAVAGVAHSTLVAFLTSGCSTCVGFWETFARGAPEIPGDARLVIVTQGPEMESASRLAKFAPSAIPVVMSSAAWQDYEVPTAPYFAYVDGPTAQVVGEGAGMTWDQVTSFIDQALDDAGLEREGRRGSSRRRSSGGHRADQALLSAGITAGHPSLYGSTDAVVGLPGAAEGTPMPPSIVEVLQMLQRGEDPIPSLPPLPTALPTALPTEDER